MQRTYLVVGGEYQDTNFKELVAGAKEERHGPFSSYKDATDVWRARSWQNVDNCHCRFFIIEG